MKKFAVLTSVLALAACGGGSGSHPGNPNTPGAVTTPYRDAVRESNQKVTSMISNSEYQVVRYVVNKLGDDAADVNLSRSATTRGAFTPSAPTGNMDYDKAKELVELAAWLVDNSTTHSDITTMFTNSSADKNKIKAALKLMNDMWCFVGGDANETANRIISRRATFETPLAELQHNTEVFNLNEADLILSDGGFGGKLRFNVNDRGEIDGFEMLPDEDDPEDEGLSFTTRTDGEQSGYTQFTGTVEHQDAVLTYHSMGKELGLTYSDFGHFDIDIGLFNNWHVPFIGGYTTKQIADITTIQNQVNFNGKATGHVVKPNYYAHNSPAMIPLDSDAHLTFNPGTGKTVLTASFDNWYDIEYTKNGNAMGSIEFTNYKDNGLEGNPNLQFSNEVMHDGVVAVTDEDIRYFGNNNTASEAVGLIQIRDCQGAECGDNDSADYLRMNLGFGAK